MRGGGWMSEVELGVQHFLFI